MRGTSTNHQMLTLELVGWQGSMFPHQHNSVFCFFSEFVFWYGLEKKMYNTLWTTLVQLCYIGKDLICEKINQILTWGKLKIVIT